MASPQELLTTLIEKVTAIKTDWEASIARKNQKLNKPTMFQSIKAAVAGGVTPEEIAEKNPSIQ